MKSTDCAVLSIKAETWYESSHRVGLALCWKAEGLNSTSAPLYLQKVVVCGHCLVTLSLTIKETLKWFELLPILMQESFWWWQCSDRYIISLFPLLQTLSPPFPVPNKPYEVMFFVDVKHHVYLVTYFNHHWRQHQSWYWWKPKIETEENGTKSKHMHYQTKSLYDELFSKKKYLKKKKSATKTNLYSVTLGFLVFYLDFIYMLGKTCFQKACSFSSFFLHYNVAYPDHCSEIASTVSLCVEIVILNVMCLWPCWWCMNKLRRLGAFAVSPLWSLDISWCVLYDCVKYFHYTRRVTSKHGVRSESDCLLFASTVFFSNHAVIQASSAV